MGWGLAGQLVVSLHQVTFVDLDDEIAAHQTTAASSP
jgi:hypothetical protein